MMRTLVMGSMILLGMAACATAEDTQSLHYYRGYMSADRAYRLLADQEYAKAIPHLERAVKQMPDKPDYRTQLIDTLVHEKRLGRASQVVEDGLEQQPNNAAWKTRKDMIDAMLKPVAPPAAKKEVAALTTAKQPVRRVVATPKPTPFATADAHYKKAQQLQQQGDHVAALVELEKAQKILPENPVFTSSLGYAYRAEKRNNEAITLFQKSLAKDSNAMVREDMAWAMKEEGRREESADALKGVLPSISDADKHYALRREIQQLEDNWTSVGSITYRDGLARSSGIPGLQNYNESLQYGFETVYSPDSLQRDGRRLLQFYGQAFASSNSSEYDFNDNTTQGAVGVRSMPVPNLEWYLYAAKLFHIGTQAIDDWQLRTTYAYTEGFDIDPNRDAWRYLFATPDISYLTDRGELFATFEGRYGQSYRFNDWVLTPHLVGAAAHNHSNANGSRDSLEYGPGISVKYWFDETVERAPTGSAEMILQWREAVGPSEDRSGPFVRFVVQY